MFFKSEFWAQNYQTDIAFKSSHDFLCFDCLIMKNRIEVLYKKKFFGDLLSTWWKQIPAFIMPLPTYPTKLQAAVYLCDLSYFAYFLDIRHVFWCFHNGKVNTNFEVFCKAQTERKQSKCRKANSSNPRFNKEHST